MENYDTKLYEFGSFKQYANIVHGVFTRPRGAGKGQLDSLNKSINPGDKNSVISNNRELIKQKMGVKPLVFLNQVHGKTIKVLKKRDTDLAKVCQSGKGTCTADGVITDMKNLFLVIQVADCQAVILYDRENKVIANIHSGWKGSVENIIGECVAQMISEFRCQPENIIAGISPSLGPCCSEFINYKDEIPETLWKYKYQGKDYFDFWKMSCDQLMDKGIKRDNIENMEICTKCNMNEFYSFRGDKTTGRFVCVISMV